MSMKDYEEKAKKIQEQAERLQASMLSIKKLTECAREGHKFDLDVECSNHASIDNIIVHCSRCGAFGDAEGVDLRMPENEEAFGDLSDKFVVDIEIEIPEEVEDEVVETEEVKTEYKEEQSSDGTYKVDVSSILGKKKEGDE